MSGAFEIMDFKYLVVISAVYLAILLIYNVRKSKVKN